ncbi:MAG: DUF5680 domain-containing protein [Candidatus Bathyarchaeota archaeon]|nr:DUF5680 domain-containing protein [Candidatus Bathyarchaeota archaeon]
MKIETFLVSAKKATYAEGGDDAGLTLPDSARELSYSSGDLVYRDRYYGWDPFAGEEVVTCSNRVVWLLNYYGRCHTDCVDPSQVYSYLIKALSRVTEKAPYRGPDKYEEDGFKYTCSINGSFKSFFGSEKILFRGKDVYWLNFHGGEILWKTI